jgi:hypothetical protein
VSRGKVVLGMKGGVLIRSVSSSPTLARLPIAPTPFFMPPPIAERRFAHIKKTPVKIKRVILLKTMC